MNSRPRSRPCLGLGSSLYFLAIIHDTSAFESWKVINHDTNIFDKAVKAGLCMT